MNDPIKLRAAFVGDIRECVQPKLTLTPRQRKLIETCAIKAGISAEEFLEELIQLTAERWLCRPGATVTAMEKAQTVILNDLPQWRPDIKGNCRGTEKPQ